MKTTNIFLALLAVTLLNPQAWAQNTQTEAVTTCIDCLIGDQVQQEITMGKIEAAMEKNILNMNKEIDLKVSRMKNILIEVGSSHFQVKDQLSEISELIAKANKVNMVLKLNEKSLSLDERYQMTESALKKIQSLYNQTLDVRSKSVIKSETHK
jgi:hypothetical protein